MSQQPEQVLLKAAPGGEGDWPEGNPDTANPDLVPTRDICEVPEEDSGCGHRYEAGRTVRGSQHSDGNSINLGTTK